MTYTNDDFPVDDEPLFNIGAVTRMTGIPESTLRMWERRYAFPASQRTAGGHRLYSQREVARLRWVKQRVDEGMQIRQAIHALQHLEREGEPAVWAPAPPRLEPGGASAELFCQQLTEALFRHDSAGADQVLSEAYPLLPMENLVLDVIGPALREIGDAWRAGRIGVATEHFASHYLRARLVLWLRAGPPAYPVSPVVLACAPGELHEGSLLMLGGVIGLLLFNTSMQQASFAATALESQATNLAARQQTLEMELERLRGHVSAMAADRSWPAVARRHLELYAGLRAAAPAVELLRPSRMIWIGAVSPTVNRCSKSDGMLIASSTLPLSMRSPICALDASAASRRNTPVPSSRASNSVEAALRLWSTTA